MKYSNDLKMLMLGDKERQRLLLLVRSLALPDCWIAAGAIRNAVWDFLHQREPSPPSCDVDVIWFDPAQNSKHLDLLLEKELNHLDGSVKWSVENQSRMHFRNDDRPYQSACDAMRFWPETATAVGVRCIDGGELEIAAPFGLTDLFGAIVRPTPHFYGDKRVLFDARLQSKKWLEHWPLLRVERDPIANKPYKSTALVISQPNPMIRDSCTRIFRSDYV
jgi:hypothetical protein